MKVDVGHMGSMMSIVNSIVGTKPACHLSESEKQFISVLVMKVGSLLSLSLCTNLIGLNCDLDPFSQVHSFTSLIIETLILGNHLTRLNV